MLLQYSSLLQHHNHLFAFHFHSSHLLQPVVLNQCIFITSIRRAVNLSWLKNASSYPLASFGGRILTSKVGQTDLVSICDQNSLVGLWMQDYKSLCAAVKICATPG